MPHLFAYGTLEIPSVLERVTGRRWHSQPVRLPDHARYLMLGRNYPGIVPARGQSVSGILHHDLDERTFDRLDSYEGSEYVRAGVEVESVDGVWLDAETYVVAPGSEHLLSRAPWSRAAFEQHHLAEFLAHLAANRGD